MIGIHDDFATVLDHVTIETPSRYRVVGKVRELSRDPANASELPALVSALADDVYRSLYVRPTPARGTVRANEAERRDFAAALSSANTGRGAWEAGWFVERIDVDGGGVVANKRVWFRAAARELRGLTGPIEAGTKCRVKVPNELRSWSQGYYIAIGDADQDMHESDGERDLDVRYYWHLTSDAAVRFLGVATALMNRARIPFRMKVLSDPSAYYRADAGVIFVSSGHQAEASAVIAEIYVAVASHVRSHVPLFTLRLADGLGIARHFAGISSFGESRSLLVAQSLWTSFVRGEMDNADRAATIADTFRDHGLDPCRPYLESRTVDTRRMRWPSIPEVNPATARGATIRLTPHEAAARLAARICAGARWDRQHRLCNWMGQINVQSSGSDGAITPVATALGADLYGGSAGVALFLAEIARATGNPEFRAVAQGAITRSIRQLDMPSKSRTLDHPLSFHSGRLGVAFAAWRISELLDVEGIYDQARMILDGIHRSLEIPHEIDVIGGNAGAIPALLAMGRVAGLEWLRELAVVLGEELYHCTFRETM